jgi:hypothetical protein
MLARTRVSCAMRSWSGLRRIRQRAECSPWSLSLSSFLSTPIATKVLTTSGRPLICRSSGAMTESVFSTVESRDKKQSR